MKIIILFKKYYVYRILMEFMMAKNRGNAMKKNQIIYVQISKILV